MNNNYKYLKKFFNKEKKIKTKEDNKFINRFLYRKRLFKSYIYK